jgi:hypothetical protein
LGNEHRAWHFQTPLDQALQDSGYVLHDHHDPHDIGFMHVVGTVRRRPMGGAVGALEVSTKRLVGSTDCWIKSSPVRKPFPLSEPLGTDGGQNRDIDLML